jgi:mono/diheme cytochrome c family protein
MKRGSFRPTCCCFILWLALVCKLDAAPKVHGIEGTPSHSLKEAGEVLVGELQCSNCHEGERDDPLARKRGPNLREVGRRLDPGYLLEFLTNPHDAHGETKMPDLMGSMSAGQRKDSASALSAFLRSLGKEKSFPQWEEQGNSKRGKVLFEEVGCMACHAAPSEGPARESEAGLGSLVHVAGKYDRPSLAGFLHEPLRVRKSGRMPDFHLTRSEANDLAEYLVRGRQAKIDPPKIVAEKIEKGRVLFGQLNCVACHSLEGMPASKPALPMKNLRKDRGCLSEKPQGVPDYGLSGFQRKAIGQALAEGPESYPPERMIKRALTAFNCIACHERDDYGGPSVKLKSSMKSSQEGLGDHGRFPPSLSLVGAKLKPGWINKVMFDGDSARPYVHTRMPSFGEQNLGFLPALFSQVDQLPEVKFPEIPRKKRGEMRSAGHKLVGDKGLNCVACHVFNGKVAGGFKGLDLLASYDRLNPDWFVPFMLNPAKFRPGIVMPIYWSNGKGAHEDILDGNASAQLHAIWHYLSYGQGAPTPSGIGNPGTNLEVADRARVYRGRSRVAGYRGISVGFPEGIHYAFNAETGALSALWKGEFVSVGWGGQGAGNFNPRSRSVQLSQDFAFQPVNQRGKPWPILPKMTKENPVNPDPLYPKNLGYRFRGYSLDDHGVPTFSYEFGELAVEDFSRPQTRAEVHLLRRTLRITSPAQDSVLFRALVGKIEREKEGIFATPELRLKILDGQPRLREGREGNVELIIELSLKKGKSEFVFDYEALR